MKGKCYLIDLETGDFLILIDEENIILAILIDEEIYLPELKFKCST